MIQFQSIIDIPWNSNNYVGRILIKLKLPQFNSAPPAYGISELIKFKWVLGAKMKLYPILVNPTMHHLEGACWTYSSHCQIFISLCMNFWRVNLKRNILILIFCKWEWTLGSVTYIFLSSRTWRLQHDGKATHHNVLLLAFFPLILVCWYSDI